MTSATLPEELNHTIQAELEPGEQIRWTGQPLVTSGSTGMIWGVFIFGIPWTAFAIFWTVMASGVFENSHGQHFQAGRLLFGLFGLPFIGVGVLLLTSPWRAKKKLAKAIKQTAYVITDRRAILLDSGYVAFGPALAMISSMPGTNRMLNQGLRVQSFRPERLTNIERIQREDGSGDILFADNPTVIQTDNGVRTLNRVGFIGIPQVRAVEKLLQELVRKPSGDAGPDAPPVIETVKKYQ